MAARTSTPHAGPATSKIDSLRCDGNSNGRARPVAEDSQPDAQKLHSPSKTAEVDRSMTASQGAHILVVEDEHLVGLHLESTLRQMGHTPVLVHTGEEAIKAFGKGAIDLVLMDIKLRNMLDGIDTATEIRRTHDVPLIYLTAYADDQTLERARRTEPNGYLLKPFQDRELRATIEMTLHRRRGELKRLEAQEQKQFLADAVVRLTSTLDHRAVAREAVSLVIPKFADWCIVDCATEPVSDVDAEIEAVIERVRQSGVRQVVSDVGTTLKAKELVVIPLVARSETIGVFAAALMSTRDAFTTSEIQFLEEFAQRLAGALDKAMLYELLIDKVSATSDVTELPLFFAPWSVADIVKDAVEMFLDQAREQGIRLAVEVPEAELEVPCDRGRIVKVLGNLIASSLKFAPLASLITIRARPLRTGVSFEVCEPTPEASIDECLRLFERFWRLRADDTTGLGLFVARNILEAHGSSLALEAHIGRQSRFYFVLPTTAAVNHGERA